VSYTRNSGSSQDGHGTTLAGSQNKGADNSTNGVDVTDLCTNSITPIFEKIRDNIITDLRRNDPMARLCEGFSMKLLEGKNWI